MIEVEHDGVRYAPTKSSEEYGWCWCADGCHEHHAHATVGWAPYWCGSRHEVDRAKRIIPFNKRKGMHLVKRSYLLLRTAAEVIA